MLSGIFNKFLTGLSKIFFPILGKQAISKENRFVIELNDRELTICKFKKNNKTITSIKNEIFDFGDKKRSLQNEEDQIFYLDQIIKVFKKYKLIGNEVTVVLPTADTIIKTVNIPLMDEETLKLQTEDPEFWQTFDELNGIIDGKTISYQLLSINEETQEQEALICLFDNEKINSIHEVLKLCGVKPTIYEPKCFSMINAILACEDQNFNKEIAFFEYGEIENYLITITENKFIFAKNNIHRSDIVLIKQLEKMPDPSGPFWSEVFERSIQDIRGNLMDDEWKGKEENKTVFRNLYVHTDLEKSEKYLAGLQSKLPEFKIKKISFNESPGSKDIEQINILEKKLIKFPKKIKKELELNLEKAAKFYPLIGASLRSFNPFKIIEKNQTKFAINLYPYKDQLQNRLVVSGVGNILNIILLLLMLTFSLIIYFNFQNYTDKKMLISEYSVVKNDYDSLINEINTTNSSVKNIEKEIELIERVANQTSKYETVIEMLPNLTPNGVEIQSIEYKKEDITMTIYGHAITDYDLSIFLKNITEKVGTPDISNVGISSINQLSEEDIQLSDEISQYETTDDIIPVLPNTNNYLPKNQIIKLRNFRLKVKLV